MTNSNITHSTFGNSDLSAILCDDTNFAYSNFMHVKFDRADLRNTGIMKSKFSESFTHVTNFAGLDCEIHIIHDNLRIGDKCFTIDDWKQLTDTEILKMDDVIQNIWGKYKEVLIDLTSISMMTPCKYGEPRVIKSLLLTPKSSKDDCPFEIVDRPNLLDSDEPEDDCPF